MRAAIDQNQSVRSFDGESELGELEGARNLGNGVQQKNAWSDFHEFIDEDEVAGVVEFSCAGVLGIGAVEIPHFRRQRRFGAEERRRQLRAAKTVGAVGGDVNSDVRIDFEEISQPGGVVRVTVRDNDEVEFREINVEGLDVVLEDFGIVASVEEDVLAIVLDEGGKSPVSGELRIIAERVVEDRDAVGREGGARQKGEAKETRKARKAENRTHRASKPKQNS